MLKVAAIFGLALFVCFMQTYPQTQKAQETETHATPTHPTPRLIPQKDDSQNLQPKADNHVNADIWVVATPKKDLYDRAAFWVTVTLAVIGAVGIVAAFITLRKLERQTKATEKQADHMVASERAWLVIRPVNKGQTLKRGSPPPFYWEVKNVGKTPARLIQTQAACVIRDDWNLPDIADFPAPILLGKRVLAPGDSIEFSTYWQDKEGYPLQQVSDPPDFVLLLVYGYVKYLTVLGGSPRESNFCDDFLVSQAISNTIAFRPYLDAPPAYTEHT